MSALLEDSTAAVQVVPPRRSIEIRTMIFW
jgi:hypothetical protein